MKKIYKILLIFMVIFIIGNSKSYASIGKNLDKKITNWTSGGFTGWTEELTNEAIADVLANLKNDFQYQGDRVNNEMRMLTKVSVEDKKQTIISHLPWLENKYKYTLRIRHRNR